MDAVRHTIDLPTGIISYRAIGPADGSPVVLVHGFFVDGAVWGDVPERLAARGLRVLVPTWPLGAHASAMATDADLSPPGIARIVGSFLRALDLRDVTLIGNDAGGVVCQFFVADSVSDAVDDLGRVGRLILTNCDAFEVLAPFPFNLLLRLVRHPGPARAILAMTRWARLRNGVLGFGALVCRPLTVAETAPWLEPYLTNAAVRRDVARFARGCRRADLIEAGKRLAAFERPVLVCWAPRDRVFPIALGRRLAAAFPDARLIQINGSRTYVALDQPAQLATEIAGFAAEMPGC